MVSTKNGEAVKQQLALFHENGDRAGETVSVGASSPDALATFMTNFVISSEARINEMREKLFQAERKFEAGITQVEKLVQKEKAPKDLLEIINSFEPDRLAAQLTFYGADKAKVEAICQARRQKENGGFETYQELLKATKGLGEKGLVVLIDRARSYNR